MLGPAGGSAERSIDTLRRCALAIQRRLVEALSERISDQGPRFRMVPADPAVDISQQLLPLFDGDAVL